MLARAHTSIDTHKQEALVGSFDDLHVVAANTQQRRCRRSQGQSFIGFRRVTVNDFLPVRVRDGLITSTE